MRAVRLMLTILIISIFASVPAYGISPPPENIIRVAGDNNYPPYEYVDDNENFKGFNVDIIRAVAIELGWDIELIPVSWESATSMLKNKEVDLVQGMTVTEEREILFDFTQEIVTNSQNIFVLEGITYINELSDLEGKTVSIQAEDVTRELLSTVPNVTIVEKVNQLEAIQMLLNNEVDAFVGNRLTGIYNIQKYGLTNTIKITGDPLYKTKYSMAVSSGDEALLKELNKGISAIKSNGTYEKIYKKWFGETLVDVAKEWKELLTVTIIALLASLILIIIIYLWNKKLKEQVLARTEQLDQNIRFKDKVIDNIIDGFISFDKDLKITQFNSIASKLLEKNIEVGQDIIHVMEDRLPVESLDTISSGTAWNSRLEWNLKDNGTEHVDCRISPINGPNGVEGFIFTINDKTKEAELYNMAKHTDKMNALGELSAGLAHELRNPLTSIKTFIDLIPMKIGDENFKKELINIVPKELNRLDELVGSLLDYSKPKNPNPKMISLGDIISEILTLFKKKLQEKNIKVVTNNIDVSFFVDASQLKQILINIILNSIDAIDKDGLIEINTQVLKNKNAIIITDNGSGIPEEKLNAIFDPFYTSKKNGQGIGLSITDRLIRDNKGEIKVLSEIGVGTTMIIYLPNAIDS